MISLHTNARMPVCTFTYVLMLYKFRFFVIGRKEVMQLFFLISESEKCPSLCTFVDIVSGV